MNESGADRGAPMPSPERQPPPFGGLISECWNGTGVYGNGQCSSLKEYAHCRHCPVYSAAAVTLLDRPLPPGYRAEWAAYFGAGKDLGEPGNISVVPFRVGSEWLALPTQILQEVAERRPIHSLPRRQQGPVAGLANVRGELLVCISLGHLIGLRGTPSPHELRAGYVRLLVANWDENRFAFPVHEVGGPQRFRGDELKRPPAKVSRLGPAYSQAVVQWQGQSVGILNPGLLFTNINRSLS